MTPQRHDEMPLSTLASRPGRPQPPRLPRTFVGTAFAGVAIVALVVASAGAGGQSVLAVQQRMVISYEIAPDGVGELAANLNPDGSGTYSWMRCPPGGGACSPVTGSAGNRVLRAGSSAPGTTFVASATNGTGSSAARTVPYRGLVMAIAAPRVRGRLRVGSFVQPVKARWVGGWGTERDLLQVQVCRSRSGAGCAVLSDSVYANRCVGVGAVIASRYRGWFVRIVDQRIGRDTAFARVAFAPGHVPVLVPGPDAASSLAGPIAGPRAHVGPGACR
jgi:hypothetical protein